MRQIFTDLLNTLQPEIAAQKDAEFLIKAFAKLTDEQQVISFREYSKVSDLLAKLASDKKLDSPKKEAASAGLSNLLANHTSIVDPKDPLFILPNGRMPNAACIASFIDTASNQPYVVMIKNGNFNEYTPPAGKVDKADAVIANGVLNEQLTYANAALREFREEALNSSFHAAFSAIAQSAIIETVDRDALKIPEFNKHYDTRILTVFLGRQSLAQINGMLKEPDEKNKDSQAAFCQPLASLAYSALRSEAAGQFTNYFLTINGVELKVRPTLLAVTNDQGFANKIANEVNSVAQQAV
jgi:hypothetical protein